MNLDNAKLQRILEHYGEGHQRWNLVEEIGDLLAELGRFRNGDRANVADLVHEMADVIVVASQLYPEPNERTLQDSVETGDRSSQLAFNVSSLVSSLVSGIANHYPSMMSHDVTRLRMNAEAHAKWMGVLPMLLDAIDMKIDRQIERIVAEGKR